MISFRMTQIKVEQFAILSETLPKDGHIGVETTFAVSVDAKSHAIGMRLKVSYLAEEKMLLTLVLVCTFTIDEDSWIGFVQDNTITIPHGFLAHMAVHTLGTARGVLFCKTENTVFQQLIIPPTNVDAAFAEDMVIHKAQ